MIDIRFGPQICGDADAAAAREWLVTDGLGGYAMGTVGGLRTRRYHGLLIAAGETPAARHLGLVSLDPAVTLPGGARVRLGAHEWAPGTIDPRGFELLERFDLTDGLPRWRWQIGDVVIEREIAMAHGRCAVAVVHRLLAGGPVRLELSAVCTWRDAHGERGSGGAAPVMRPAADGVVVEEALRIAGPGWEPAGQWWLGAYHREEAARGLAASEDLWHAGSFASALERPGDVLGVRAWTPTPAQAPPPAEEVVGAARARHRAVVAAARPADEVQASLALAADAFVIDTPRGPDVVAGYPWFGCWSRDTMIAYEGLFLATGRAAQGRELLRGYAATLSEGMLANTADTGRVEYNTVDATLWFLHAVARHVQVAADDDLAAELFPALRTVVDAHLRGTRYGIGVDPADGLLTQGAPGAALTWMDARVDEVPVTPRAGKAVEVNALWVNGLAAVAGLAERIGAQATTARAAHGKAVASFRRRFPAPAGWLHDVVDAPAPAYPRGAGPRHDDDQLRPNQLLAWSLPYAPMTADAQALRMIGARLLTPLGLRTLAPGLPGYAGSHRGGPAQRDRAYHQGTVWPWLLGPWVDAHRRADLPMMDVFAGIDSHLGEFGLGSVSETADGSAPHLATGCPFQAWSVGEVLRARGK